MKKALSILLILAMAVSLMAGTASAASADLTTGDFNLVLTENEGTLTVALQCSKAVSGFGAGSGVMSISDSSYFTLDSIAKGELVDMTPNKNKSSWGASAADYENGDSMDEGAWVTYTYTVSDSIPNGNYTFVMTLGNDFANIGFEKYSCANGTVTATYTVGNPGGGEVEEPADYTLTLTADKTEVKVDETVKVTATVTGAVFNGIQGAITYDPEVFALQSATGIGLKEANSAELEQVFTDTAAGTAVAELTFKALKTADSSAITATATIGNYVSFKDNCVDATVVPVSVKVNPKTYTITVAASEHGSVTPGKTEAAAGETISLNVAPATGYELESLSYTVNGQTTVITGTIFVMPEGNVTINASFKESAKPWTVATADNYVNGYTLVTVIGEDAGYTYDGKAMYKVAAGKFAYLVEGPANTELVAEGTSVAGDLSGALDNDVNGTGKVDFNDAGAAFGCANLAYDVTADMAIYLRADVDGNSKVDAADVNAILGVI